MLTWLLLAFGTTFCSTASKQFSTVRSRITEQGLKFFSRIGHHIVDYEIWQVTCPDITLPIKGGPGTGEVNVTELTVRRFGSPKFVFELAHQMELYGSPRVDPRNWMASGMLYTTSLHRAITAPFKISLSGYVKAKVNDIRINMQTNVLVREEHPQIEVSSCSMDVQQLDVYIEGGVIQWIINLFHKQLADLIKNTIHKKMCDIVRVAVVDQINAALSSLPTHAQLFKNLYINYSCRQQPIATRKYIQGEIISEVTYGEDRCTLPTKPMDNSVDSAKRMAHIWVSEHIPNCLLQTVYNNEMLNFSITPNTSGGRFANFLKTDCSSFAICIGKYFPALRLKYPNRTIDLFIKLTNAPYVAVDINSSRIFANSIVDLYLSPWEQQANRLARLVSNSTICFVPMIEHKKLVGTISNVTVLVLEHDSTIGHFNPRVLGLLEKLLAKAIRIIGGTAIKIGIPLPVIDNVTVSDDAQIVTKHGFIRIDFDFIYE